MSNQENQEKNNQSKKRINIPSFHKLNKLAGNPAVKSLFVVFAIVMIASSAYHMYFAKRVIPGVVVGNVKIGGMTYATAKQTLSAAAGSQPDKLQLKAGEKTFDITTKDISFEYNWDATLSRAYEIGRTGNLFTDAKDKLAGIFKPLYIKAFYDYDEGTLSARLVSISGELNRIGEDAKFVLENGQVKVVKEVSGQKVDYEQLFNDVIKVFDNIDFKVKGVLMEEDLPDILSTDLEPLTAQTQKILDAPLKVVYGDKKWEISKDQRSDFLTAKKEKAAPVYLGLNKTTFEGYLDLLAQQVNEAPRGIVTELADGKVKKFEMLKAGKELDSKKFTDDFKDALFTGKPEVQIATKEVTELANPEKLGIRELLASGSSKFTGSGAGRVKNLSLAAERTNGVLVPPDGVYSFNNAVGEISAKTGYDSAYIIQNGRTVLGEGGGVCQTSTTLFRAVLESGLPIVSRHPHAYRVVYYELDRKVGFDASVYQPTLDFQFRNDTKNYILVQSKFDKQNYSLTFEIYGTKDGREVEISEPAISNVTPPPEALYQDDPTLAKGVVKQVDFAAWGASVTFNRVVKKDGIELFKDTFSSRYQPWRAIYLRGTKV